MAVCTYILKYGPHILVTEKFRLVYSIIKFTIHIMCCLIIQSKSVVFGNRKHYMNSTTGLSPISSCFCPMQKKKIHVRWSSKQNTPQPPLLFFWLWQELDFAASVGAIGFCFQEEWVTPTAIHGEQKYLFLPASWLSFNQILIGCSHFTTHKQYLAEVKKVNLSCFGERNKDWSAGVKACRQNNCIDNSNYYLQKTHNTDLLGYVHLIM